ncbi:MULTISPECIES: chromate transporter [Vibrio]|uniref:Chromate transporter n=2 Tax=Vibrio TaxID=662 RepID=A0A7X4LLL1_9VIBR|nr:MULTISPECIES: chromate transporter [Vibrio]MBF9000204.1 chromate transporter [Vibrio nitrifigilis]MZI94040.1 chromate transporter [Vibrio eleionomae]
MLYLDIFLAFFIPNIVGYGGGPAIIPLIEDQVVGHYHWMTTGQFSEVLALGNALPSPIATKMSGYIGYQIAGAPGAAIALIATVAPTLIIMIVALSVLYKFRNSPKVKAMSQWVLPVVTVLMAALTYKLFAQAFTEFPIHFVILFVASAFALNRFKIHPTLVIAFSLAYGAILM